MDWSAALHPESDLHVGPGEPWSFEPAVGPALGELPEPFRERVMVDAIHDGDLIPPEFLVDQRGRPIDPALFRSHYELDRDWGAGLVAGRLAGALGLPGFYKVRVARVLMDYGRFPGITSAGADYLRRFAINYPFSGWMSHDQKRRLLEDYYDRCSTGLERLVQGKLIKIACHTYDRLNASGTTRPHVSLVTRSLAYQTDSRMPTGVFDPLYPDLLAEFTADRILTDRISLDLEKSGVPVAHNYPYCLPEGSIEVRAQVWYFFQYVRQRFEISYPDTAADPAFRRVWDMLLDTNLRSTSSDALRSYLHLYRHPPVGREEEFRHARIAYERVKAFIEGDDRRLVQDYRYWEERPSTLGVEVRKDLVWEFSGDRPVRPRVEVAWRIAEGIARAVLHYLTVDRPERTSREQVLGRIDPWYRAPTVGVL